MADRIWLDSPKITGGSIFLPERSTLAFLTRPQQATFKILGVPSNLASVEVLRCALGSPLESVKNAALETLLARGGLPEMTAILERIDECTQREIPSLKAQAPQLQPLIESGLASKSTEQRQQALIAIAKLEIASQFHLLIQVAQSHDDPQQLFASEYLFQLAKKMGERSRKVGSSSPSDSDRKQLLNELWNSLERPDSQRITLLFDAWLCGSHWEDDGFKSVFDPSQRNVVCQLLLRQLKHTHQFEVLELMCGILWSKKPFHEAVQMLAERKEESIPSILAGLVQSLGVVPQLRKNLACCDTFFALDHIDFASDRIPIEERVSLLKLLMESQAPPDRMLSCINQMLETRNAEAETAAAAALRSLQNLKVEIVVMALSDGFDSPDIESYEPPPWKAGLRAALERLIDLYPHQIAVVRNSIEYVFSDFRCEEMFKHLDDWPESHMIAYGKLVRIADRGYCKHLEREAQSQSSAKRIRAMKIARYLTVDDAVREIVSEALNDRDEKVKIEAIHAIACSIDIHSAIEILVPLIQDDDAEVKSEAVTVLDRLEKFIQC